MNLKISKYLTIVTGILGLIGVIFYFRVILAGDDPIKNSVDLQASLLDPFITFSLFLFYISVIIALGFALVNLYKHPETLKATILSVAVLGVLLVVAYSMADGGAVTDAVGNIMKDGQAGPTSKWVSALINYTFILAIIAIVGYVYDFVKSLIN